MAEIDLKRFMNNFARQQMFTAKGTYNANIVKPQSPQVQQKAPELQPQAQTPNVMRSETIRIEQNLQFNTLQSMDRAIYAKDLMQMPKNINEFIYMLQRGMTQSQFNQMFANQLAAQRNSLSQLQAQILAQLQGLATSTAKEMVNVQLANQLQNSLSLKNLDILSGGMINLSEISVLLQKNGKEALTKLIMSMTEASKSGITDLTQMKEMAKLINASIAVASENNPQKTLKLLLMLYLPWLPLEDGVGFDLEVESKSQTADDKDSILTVTITTVNFGQVIATLVLETSNSVHLSIECSDKFPKTELQFRLDKDKKNYSVDAVTSFEEKKDIKPVASKPSANINTSQTNEVNPYLLLMAHSIIKHVIDIDNNTSIGLTSHAD